MRMVAGAIGRLRPGLLLLLGCVPCLAQERSPGRDEWERTLAEMRRKLVIVARPASATAVLGQPVILDVEWRRRGEARHAIVTVLNQITCEPPLVAEYHQQGAWGSLIEYRGLKWLDHGPPREQPFLWGPDLRMRTRRVIYEIPGDNRLLTGNPGQLQLRLSYNRGRIVSDPLTIAVSPDGVSAKIVTQLQASLAPARVRGAFELDFVNHLASATLRDLARRLVAQAAGTPLEPYLRHWLAFEETLFFDWRECRTLAAGSSGERALAVLDALIAGTRDAAVRESTLYLAYLITRFAKERTGKEGQYLEMLRKGYPDSYFLWEIDQGCVRQLTLSHRGCGHTRW